MPATTKRGLQLAKDALGQIYDAANGESGGDAIIRRVHSLSFDALKAIAESESEARSHKDGEGGAPAAIATANAVLSSAALPRYSDLIWLLRAADNKLAAIATYHSGLSAQGITGFREQLSRVLDKFPE